LLADFQADRPTFQVASYTPGSAKCNLGFIFYENPVLVATLTAFSREAWAFDGQKNPRLAATAVANALTVATPAIFMGGGAPNRRMNNFYENEFRVHALACLRQWQPKG
jgi:hypothetical protein